MDEINWKYPKVKRDEKNFVCLHSVKILDPYSWLEDPESEETRLFIELQNNLINPYLENCIYREVIRKSLTQMWNYERYSCPIRKGNNYFYFHNTGLQNQNVLLMQDNLTSEPQILLDPNEFSLDGTVSLTVMSVSENGETLAYGLSKSGSDWMEIFFRSVKTGKDMQEVLKHVKFTKIEWSHDNRGVFYGRYHPPYKADGTETDTNTNQKLYYHQLNTSQDEDILVAQFPSEPKWMISAEISDCGSYLFLYPHKDCRDNLVFFCNLNSSTPQISEDVSFTPIIDKFEADFEYVTNINSHCIFRTNKNAPNYHLISIDVCKPESENWKVVIPEHSVNVLEWAACVHNNKLVICYIENVKLLTTLFKDVGSIVGFSGKKKNSEFFYQVTSFLIPGIILYCDLTSSLYEPKIFKEVKVNELNDLDYISKQEFYESKDGTKIPMFIVHKKSVELNSKTPCLLYGYGGFNISVQPVFSITRILFMKNMDGVLAVPNIRGGGEYGEKWHNAGRLKNKQNVFDDFQYAAKYLIENNYTSPSLITIQGGSNGGLLVGACINQKPDLFGCAIIQVGVLDMLKFHKFTIGYSWCSDYGNPDDIDDFYTIMKYSPLHNITLPPEGVQYPAVLLLTADHDDRVVPLHSLKFIAELQYIVGKSPHQTNPLLIKIDTKAGHGAGKPVCKIIDESTDILSFMIQALKLRFHS